MAKTKAEKITSIEEEIRQLENRRRQLVQEQKAQERKDRTKRLCRRMGLFESLVPDTIPLTEEQFKTFLEKTVMSDQARRILDELTARNAPTAPAQDAETAAQGNTPPAAKTARGQRRRGRGRGRSTRVTGLRPYPCLKQGRTYIPHECGMCGLADGVLCLSAQKKTAGVARRKERGAWQSTIAVSKSYPAARANPLLPPPLTGRGRKSQTSLTE